MKVSLQNLKRYSSKSLDSLNMHGHHIIMSEGQNKEELLENLRPLLQSEGGRWILTSDGRGLERTFHFKTFKATWVSLPSNSAPS